MALPVKLQGHYSAHFTLLFGSKSSYYEPNNGGLWATFVGQVGYAPTTFRVSGECSTDWATDRIGRGERSRTFRLLRPRQASHSENTPRIYFCLRRAEYLKSIPYRTSRLAGEDNTLIVLLSIMCLQEDSSPYLQVRSLIFYPLNYGDILRLRTPLCCANVNIIHCKVYIPTRLSHSPLTGNNTFWV